jgi:hypothetical protein
MNLRAESRQLKLLDVGSTLLEEASAESLHAYIAKTHIRDPLFAALVVPTKRVKYNQRLERFTR